MLMARKKGVDKGGGCGLGDAVRGHDWSWWQQTHASGDEYVLVYFLLKKLY